MREALGVKREEKILLRALRLTLDASEGLLPIFPVGSSQFRHHRLAMKWPDAPMGFIQ